jgi:hypothetical protein
MSGTAKIRIKIILPSNITSLCFFN